MSKVSSNHPQKLPAAIALNRVSRPGWLEIIVGLVVFAIVGVGVSSQLKRLGLDPVVFGLVFTALSGIAGIAGFAAAVLLRIRLLNAFGVRPVSKRWLLIAIGLDCYCRSRCFQPAHNPGDGSCWHEVIERIGV